MINIRKILIRFFAAILLFLCLVFFLRQEIVRSKEKELNRLEEINLNLGRIKLKMLEKKLRLKKIELETQVESRIHIEARIIANKNKSKV